MEIIVWTKDQCKWCDKAKKLLKSSDLKFEERNISTGLWTKDQLLAAVPDATTVPQIVIDQKVVGGYNDLEAWWIENHFN